MQIKNLSFIFQVHCSFPRFGMPESSVSNQDLVKSVLLRGGVQRLVGSVNSGSIMMCYLIVDKFDFS